MGGPMSSKPITLAWAVAAVAITTVACEDDPKPTTQPAPPKPPATATERDGRKLSDQEIAEAVKRELGYDEMVASDGVKVRSLDGVVALTGTVPHLLAKERATKIAAAVRGVRSVSNRLDVEAVERSDEEIRRGVEHVLLMDPAAESYEVTPKVKDGIVTLQGEVESWQEKELAGQLAERVKGVKGIENVIAFDYEAERSDREIAADVEARLAWDVLVDEGLIRVAVHDGEVELTGTVGSAAERTRAASDAYVTGVQSVDGSGLEVKWWAEDRNLRKARAAADESDEDVEKAIVDAVLYDPRLAVPQIEVDVVGGVATLRGKVRSQKARQVAGRLARNTVGVHRVVNSVEVEPPPTPVTDGELAKRIERGLFLNPVTERYEIDVAVENGSVTLSGHVDSYFERAEATDVALRHMADGVLQNEIEVDRPAAPLVYDLRMYPAYPDVLDWTLYVIDKPTRTDAEIAAAIEGELFWDADVDSWQVQAKVKDGKATLTGSVDTWFERVAAELNAYEAGAVAVDNQLEVK